jgi:broad specificity phosphatase PhoE
MANKFIYLVRHGQYQSTTDPSDEPDGNLTDIGQEQSEMVAQRLSSFPISIIHHSTLQRAQETASIIGSQFPNARLVPSDLIRECIPCVPEAFRQHFEHIPSSYIEKGKGQAEQAFTAFFRPVTDTETEHHEIIVSHGNLISYFVCRILQAPCESWIKTDINLCGFSEIVISARGFTKVLRHNETGHLSVYLQT